MAPDRRRPAVRSAGHSKPAAGADPSAHDGHIFVARQPIVDVSRHVIGYELLFRPSSQALTSGTASEVASARVIAGAVSAFGLGTLTQGRRAFINITRALLLEGVPSVLPPRQVVLELLEDIEADDEVIRACADFRRQGYAIALDDFVATERTSPLVAYADVIKIDRIPAATGPVREMIARHAGGRMPKLLAEKIETPAEFVDAVAMGFDYFQGFFLGRPAIRAAREISGDQIAYLRLLHAINQPDLSIASLENLIKHDAALCYRILRTVNSAASAQRTAVASIQQALVLLGRDTLRRWASLWLMAGLAPSAHPELVVMATVRARCCELVGASLGTEDSADAFLVGLCSLLDAMLETPMESVLDQIPLSAANRAALAGENGERRRLLDCAIAYERGNWDACLLHASALGIDPALLPAAHQDALRWASVVAGSGLYS
jgi:EAL and modified HD-GYP domain-containing signal transduction protein